MLAALADQPGRQAMGQAAQAWAVAHNAAWTADAFGAIYRRAQR
jgi:hypothetical protein